MSEPAGLPRRDQPGGSSTFIVSERSKRQWGKRECQGKREWGEAVQSWVLVAGSGSGDAAAILRRK
jgi:hypothetical protein